MVAKDSRIEWIDISRGLFMIAIVLGHTYTTGDVRCWLYSFHVPAFFFISGYLSNNLCQVKTFIKKKIKTIIFPYFFFSILSIVIFGVFGLIIPKLKEITECGFVPNILVMLYGNSKPDVMRYNLPLWFLPCLFSTSMIVYIEEFISNRIKNKQLVRKIFLVLFVLGGMFFKNHELIALPYHLETAISMSVWYLIGLITREKRVLDNINNYLLDKNRIYGFGLASICLALGIKLAFFNTCTVGVRNEHYGIIILYYLSALCGIAGIVILSMLLKRNSVIQYIGKNTIGILGLHKFVIIIFQNMIPVTSQMLSKVDSLHGIICGCVVTIISIIISLLTTKILFGIVPILKRE